MVGVLVQTGTIPGPGQNNPGNGDAYFVVGQTQKGPVGIPTLITSMSQYLAVFGQQVSYGNLYNDLSMFFGEGGLEAYVIRVVGPSPTSGLLNLLDTAGSPQPTLELTAASPGSWSSNVTVTVVASALGIPSFSGQFAFKVEIFNGGVQQEVWGPYLTVASAVTGINAGSQYVVASNLSSPSSYPTSNPAVTGPTALSAGTDNRASITTPSYTNALALFPASLGSGYVAIPGLDASLVGTALIAHAQGNDRLAHLSPTEGMSQSQVEAAASAFRGISGSEFAGYWYPWVLIPNGAGGTTTVPPDGYVAACRSRTVAAIGPWQAPAGAFGVAQYVVGLDPNSPVNDTIGNVLDQEQVNCIRPRAGIRVYGWGSLSTDQVDYALLTSRDVMNQISVALASALEQYAFSVIDAQGQLFSSMANTARSVLAPYIAAGALWPGPANSQGNPTDPGYLIDTSADVNTPQTLANNEACIAVFIRPAPTAKVILCSLVKVAVGVSF